jgi:hypothetical protein
MRQDQYERLQGLQEKLIDVALDESDPDKWPGAGIQPSAMDQQTRGDRYWQKKNAVATIALTLRIEALIGRTQGFGTTPGSPDASASDDAADAATNVDREVQAAEKDAKRLLDEMQRRSRKTAFDNHVHGKPPG